MTPFACTSRALRLVVLGLAGAVAVPAGAQQAPASPPVTRTLTLEEAIRAAEDRSEAVRAARAGVLRAEGQALQARSLRMPQLDAVGQYQRALKSQFSALGGGGDSTQGPPALPAICAPPIPADASPAERAAALAQAATCPDDGPAGGIDFSRVGFGAENQWVLGLNFSQTLFTGGRIEGAQQAADAARRAAAIELVAQRAQVVLDVAQAYYDAALADRILTIADSTLDQTGDVLQQTRAARQAGSAAEFDLLRAQVAFENTRPVVIQARGVRDVAMLRLKQLLDLPLDEPLQLATDIDSVPVAVVLPAGLGAVASTDDMSTAARSAVRQAEQNVRAQEGLLRAARAERLPAIALTSNYQRLFFPRSTFPTLSNFSENWTIGIGAQLSLFNGGRVRGQALVARANLEEARARLGQVVELAALDARVAANQLAQAEATWSASQGTVEQAVRAYRIDQVRYREGIATQTDLAQTRILLQQATANRATAARDLAMARIRLALIRDLPLQPGGAGAAGGNAPAAASGAPQGQSQDFNKGGPARAGSSGGTP